MTDRHTALVVVLERANREDDVKALIDAISMFQGVLEVRPIKTDFFEIRERNRLWDGIQQLFWPSEEPR